MAKKDTLPQADPNEDGINFSSAISALANQANEENDEIIEPVYDPGHPYYKETDDDPDEEEVDDNDLPEAGTPADNKSKPKESKENPERFEYWQSQASKLQEMNDRLMAMVERGQDSDNPSIPTQTPEQILKSKEADYQAITLPPKPAKPQDYNAEDAYTNPDSHSFKYRTALDEYTEGFTEAMSKREQLRDEIFNMKLDSVRDPVQKMAQDRQLNEQQQKTVASLKKSYDFTDDQALDFVSEMSRPESMSMDNLVKFYKVTKGLNSSGSNSTPPIEDNRSRKREAAPPIPSGSGAGRDNDDIDADEEAVAFGQSLLSYTR